MTRQKKAPIDYDPRELHRDLDAAYGRAWALAQEFAKDPEYYVTLDGASKAFYGTGYRYLGKGKKERKDSMSIAGLNTTGAFRGKKGNQRGVPMYRGTESKIDWFQMVGHLYQTKASFPLAVRRGLVSADSIKEFVDLIDKLPRKPAMILGDKEFCNHKKTKDLRPACDRWGTILLLAAPRTVATVKMVNAAWHNGQAKRIPFGRKIAFWAAQEHVWADHGKVRNTLLTFYFHEDPRKDQQLTDESLMRLPNGLWSISFLTNIQVDDENAAWILARYSDRWSIENYTARVLSYTGTSHSHGMFMRDFLYEAASLLFSAYGLWRLERTQRGELDLHDRETSHSRYFGAVHRLAELALLGLTPHPGTDPEGGPVSPPTATDLSEAEA